MTPPRRVTHCEVYLNEVLLQIRELNCAAESVDWDYRYVGCDPVKIDTHELVFHAVISVASRERDYARHDPEFTGRI